MTYGCRAHDFGRHSAAGLAQILHEVGYDSAQLAMPRGIEGIDDYEHITPEQLADIRAGFAASGVEIGVLSCYQDLSDFDADARLAGVARVKKCLAYRNALGARQVGSETACRFVAEEDKAKAFDLALDSILRIVEEAARLDSVYAVEAVRFHPLCTPERLRKVRDTVADPKHLHFIFDPVNLLDASTAPCQLETWREWMDVIGADLGAMHIKDGRVLADGSQLLTPLGEGIMDYSEISVWLHRDHPDVPLIRDETMLDCAKADLAFMRKL